MKIYIRTQGDRSVGIFPAELTLEGLTELDDDDRKALAEFFSEFLGEPAGVLIEGECEDCGQANNTHHKLCPNNPKGDL